MCKGVLVSVLNKKQHETMKAHQPSALDGSGCSAPVSSPGKEFQNMNNNSFSSLVNVASILELVNSISVLTGFVHSAWANTERWKLYSGTDEKNTER
jgi:hypothetical protein